MYAKILQTTKLCLHAQGLVESWPALQLEHLLELVICAKELSLVPLQIYFCLRSLLAVSVHEC